MTINALAAELVMDRTTLGRNILPLQRDGFIAVGPGTIRSPQQGVRLTAAGIARWRSARKAWEEAQAQFETVFGAKRAKDVAHAVAGGRDGAADRQA